MGWPVKKNLLKPETRNALGGNVLFLGLVSLFTDFSSEMIYPLLPFFFTGLVSAAAAPVYIGLMDGIADSTSSLLKIYAGGLSDRLGKRKPIVVGGYTLSAIARPLMAVAFAGWHVVAFRFLDRVGKGFRSAPRDAIISESVGVGIRGLAFSFQRLMDHAGAVAGPLFAIVFLYALMGESIEWRGGTGTAGPEEMRALRWLFAIAVVPGIVSTILLAWMVREPHAGVPPRTDIPERLPSGNRLPQKFHLFLAAVVLFTLGNSSDLFLVFFAQSRFSLGLEWVIVLWIILHMAKISFSLPGGIFSDRAGRRPAILIGWMIYALVYLLIPFTFNFAAMCLLLVVYGAYYGMTEGAQLALVADFIPAPQRGQAYGLYHGAVGFAALPASLLFGVFWSVLGPTTAFLTGASFAAAASIMLYIFFMADRRNQAVSHRNTEGNSSAKIH